MTEQNKKFFEVPEFLQPLLGRHPDKIYTIKLPTNLILVDAKFEYHPVTKHVFYIASGSTVGIDVAAGVQNAHEARIVVLIWCRGYLRRAEEEQQKRDHASGEYIT